MSLAKQVEEILMGLPGKRGIDIPEHIFDQIHMHANAATQGVWGRPPTPHQYQHLFDIGAHDQEAIHNEYDKMPHPHAEGMTVGEYRQWAQAHEAWQHHTKR